MIGATMTTVGMPAAARSPRASSRLPGVAARGSMVRASFGVEGGDGDGHLDQPLLRHGAQNVDVAQPPAPILVTMPTG